MDSWRRKVEFYAAFTDAFEERLPRSPANAVRIIGGRCRGRLVRFPPAAALRPTPDRVRETLFNWLGQTLDGRATLEPYAGSGVLSLESLSRGASAAVAVDRDPRIVTALRNNAAALGLEGLEIFRADARAFVTREPRLFDVVFLDPPFSEDPWSWLLTASAARLAPGGLVYAESPAPLTPPASLATVRSDRAGQVYYHLLALS